MRGCFSLKQVALATLGRVQVVSLVTPGKPACRDGRSGLASGQAGWHRKSQAGLMRRVWLGEWPGLPVGHFPACQNPEAWGDQSSNGPAQGVGREGGGNMM